MPELINRDEEKLEQKPEAPKSEPAKDQQPEKGEDSASADEHGEPLSDESDRGSGGRVRKQPLYRRPAVLILSAVVLLIGAILLVRYWLYARSHESTDDAFIDGHIIQISPKASGHVLKVSRAFS